MGGSLQRRLLICILLVNVILISTSAFMLVDVIEKKEKAKEIATINECSMFLFSTLEALAFERGRTNVVLTSKTPLSEANRIFIAERRRQVDTSLSDGINRLASLNPEEAENLKKQHNQLKQLRSNADVQASLNLADRDISFRTIWFNESTLIIFHIKQVIEELEKPTSELGFFDFYHHFQLDCVQFRLFSGSSASTLTSVVNQGKKLSPSEYENFIEYRSKADYIWSGIEKSVFVINRAELTEKKDRVYNDYYKTYRPFQNEVLQKAMNGSATSSDAARLADLSVKAFDSIFELIREVNREAARSVDALESRAEEQLERAMLQFFLAVGFALFTLVYFRVRLFAPLERIIGSLKSIVDGRPVIPLEEELKRKDEIGLLTQGVKMLYTSLKETQKLKAQNEKLATQDCLTGLYNRQMLEQEVVKLIAHAERYEESLAMILFDLDHFKKVNDTWGHPIGDEVLIQTAQTVKKVIRSADHFFRIGGEEFLVLMPHTNIIEAESAAEKIRVAMETARHPIAGHVTASLGVSGKKAEEDFLSWYKRTDEMLYRAKKLGRNRVVCYIPKLAPVASMNVEWRDEWNSGEATIDSQHKALVNLASEYFYYALQPETDRKMIISLMVNLVGEIVKHFESEEQILEEIGYPDVKEHERIHKTLLAKAAKLQDDYVAEKISSFAFCSFFIDDIITHHMIHDDQEFFYYTQKRAE